MLFLLRRISFWPPSLVYISVIIFTHIFVDMGGVSFGKEWTCYIQLWIGIQIQIESFTCWTSVGMYCINTCLSDLWVLFSYSNSNWSDQKNSRPCCDLNPGLPRYQANMLPIELSWLLYKTKFEISESSFFYCLILVCCVRKLL